MFTKEKRIEKICSFYASDYHLEMIMIPYINKKIDNQFNVAIITQRDLSKTAKDVISKINISEKRKKELLSINWNNNKIDVINNMRSDREVSIFVVGNLTYIEKINNEIEKIEKNIKINIINCFKIEDVQEKMTEIVGKHSKVLNTTEEKEIA